MSTQSIRLPHGAAVVRISPSHEAVAPSGIEPESEASRLVRVTPLSMVKAEPITWIWRNYLPAGKVVVIDGFPGQGKSTFLLDIAARLSRGAPMPDGENGGLRRDSLVLSYEDDAADTLAPRVLAAEGDSTRIHVLEGIDWGDEDGTVVPASLPEDIGRLRGALRCNPAIGFVIVDPFMASLGAEIDSHKDQSVRRVLARLARLAAETGVCIALVRHCKKEAGTNAITAGGGSIAISGQARTVLLIDRHPKIQDASILAVSKSNIGRIPRSLTFQKVSAFLPADIEREPIETSRLNWLGPIEMTADDLLALRASGAEDDHSEIDRWLLEVLGEGPLNRKTLVRTAKDAGFSESTLDRAAKRLSKEGRLERRQSGFGVQNVSLWALRSQPELPGHSSVNSCSPETLTELDLGDGTGTPLRSASGRATSTGATP